MTLVSISILTAGAAISPIFLTDELVSFTPLTCSIHQLALNAKKEWHGHVIQALHYLGKPIDRLIQAIVGLILPSIQYFSTIVLMAKTKMFGTCTIMVLVSPVLIPIFLIAGIIQSIPFIANGALQLVVPYQTIYAIAKGKEGSREYFDFRKSLSNDMSKFIFRLPERIIEPPKTSLNKIIEDNPINVEWQSTVRKASRKDKRIALLRICDPGLACPLFRVLVLV